MTFKEWQAEVRTFEVQGLTIDDLPDSPEHDAFSAGEDPLTFAREVFEENGFDTTNYTDFEADDE